MTLNATTRKTGSFLSVRFVVTLKKLDTIGVCVELSLSFGAKEVYIFGSLADAERDHHPRDIDLGVSGLPNQVFFRTYGELLGVMDHRFDLVDLDFDSPFVRKLREHGDLGRVG